MGIKEILNTNFILSSIILVLIVLNIGTYLSKTDQINCLNLEIQLYESQLKSKNKFETFLVNFTCILADRYNDVKDELEQRIAWEETLRIQAIRHVEITAYNAHVDQCDSTPFITAYNTRVRPGIVAVSRDLYELGWTFGKKVAIEDKIYTIEDLMGPNQVNQLDIFMWSEEEAMSWGKRTLRVTLLRG